MKWTSSSTLEATYVGGLIHNLSMRILGYLTLIQRVERGAVQTAEFELIFWGVNASQFDAPIIIADLAVSRPEI
jgi:hypothetical protein